LYKELYNVRLDDSDFGTDDRIENYLEFKNEIPETLIHQYINEMTEKYKKYRKINI